MDISILSMLLSCSSYILDACSLERNRIVVSTNIIGGPSERILPSYTLVNVCSDVSTNIQSYSNQNCSGTVRRKMTMHICMKGDKCESLIIIIIAHGRQVFSSCFQSTKV